MNGLLVLALTAGMLAPVNPCGFALLPAWITHTLGEGDTHPLPVRLARSLRTGAAMTVGFAGTLAAAGLAISAGARALITAMPWLALALGLALVVLAVVMLTGRSLPLHLSLPGGSRPASGPLSVGAVVLAGAGYAIASLSCSFAVLLAVIAQTQATASYAGLLAVFAAYAGGAAAVLLLVSIATAVTGALLIRRLGVLAVLPRQVG
ncbi:cytochrome c biogenesis protein CcdA [Mycolicibacterium gadium]|uniref:cytochrome c biogenesis protein CcdA n=1 Tax=Mycolicibacterium gadium TaxID=1794 RepID=UPI002FDC8DA3